MNARKMVLFGIVLLMAVSLWGQSGAETHSKKAAASGEKMMAMGGGSDQALIEIEKKWVEAGQKQDPAILEPYLAEGFMAMSSDGAYTGRKDYLAGIKKAKWEIDEVSNMKAHVSGNHAVVTGDWRGKGTDGSGKSVDTTEHWIDSFVKSPSGKWQCTSDASTTKK
jgi:ketosteroid isomerase-like protein